MRARLASRLFEEWSCIVFNWPLEKKNSPRKGSRATKAKVLQDFPPSAGG